MAMSAATASERALRVRENSDNAVRKEMTCVPPDVPYTVLELVGKGSFGSVYKGIHNETKQVVAVKSLDLDQHDDEIKDIQKEIALLSQLKAGDAPNITAFHGSYLLGHRLWVIMDFCSGGSVRTLMKAGPIDEKYITIIVRETLTALGYLHKQGIIHRDIKAANILVGQDGRVQLCDFGVSAQLVGKSGKRNTFVGTPQWMAPEALTGGSYDSRIDIWSFGITIIEMAKQNPPLFNIPPNRVVDMIPRLPPPRLEGGNWSNNLREFVALCLNEVPDERATVDELLRSKFVKGSKGIPSSLMRELIVRYDQWANRGGVRDSMWQAALQSDLDQLGATLSSEPGWDFDTVKSRLSGVGEYIAKEMGSSAATLKATYRVPGPAGQRTAEGLVRLFQSPEEEAQAMLNGTKMGLGAMGSSSDLSFRSGASSRSITPEQKVAMISIPSFDDKGLRVPEKSISPMTQIAIPSEDETMRPTRAGASSTPRSTPTPPLLDKDRAPMVRIRRNRAGSAGSSVLRPNGRSSSPTPPPAGPLAAGATDRDVSPSPGRRPSMAASAPSSPPRLANPLGLKSHHLPSKSAPNIAVPGNGAPPLPTIRGGLVAGANGPHGKSRSQDITGLGLARGGVGMRGIVNKPGSLNLNLPPGTNGGETNGNGGLGMLPPSPSRPYYPQHTPQGSFSSIQGIGLSSLSSQTSLVGSGGSMTSITTNMSGSTLRDGEGGWGAGLGGFPVIQPLDVSVLPLDGEDPRMLEELDRVLAGLGDALEVMQVGLKGMRKWRDREVGEGGESES